MPPVNLRHSQQQVTDRQMEQHTVTPGGLLVARCICTQLCFEWLSHSCCCCFARRSCLLSVSVPAWLID